MIKLSLMAGGAALVGGKPAWGQACVDQTPMDIDVITGLGAIEVFPTSPA